MKQLVQFLQTRKQLWLILLLYIALGVLYNISLPLFESPDEFSHFRYVHWLAEERRLPDMTADYPVIGHEILQPSLYYALLALVVAAVDRSDLETVAPFNHHWRAGGGRHVYYHTSAEQFPYRQTTLAVRLARLDAIPYDGRYATMVWPPHQPFQDEVKLPPLVSNAAPGLATVWLTLYPWGSPDQRLPIYLNDQPAGHTFALTQFKIAPTQPLVYTPGHQADTQFGQLARLTGYDWPDQPLANEPLPLILYWEAVEPDGRDYAVFVHLFDLEGNLLAQADGPPQHGRYPTTIWTAGRRIRDERPLSLAEGVSSEQYRLLIGFYERETGERLVVWDGNGRQLPNGAFVIEP